MSRLSSRFVALLGLGVIILGAIGSMVTLLQTIDPERALGLVVVGGVVWATVVIGLRGVRSTTTAYW